MAFRDAEYRARGVYASVLLALDWRFSGPSLSLGCIPRHAVPHLFLSEFQSIWDQSSGCGGNRCSGFLPALTALE